MASLCVPGLLRAHVKQIILHTRMQPAESKRRAASLALCASSSCSPECKDARQAAAIPAHYFEAMMPTCSP